MRLPDLRAEVQWLVAEAAWSSCSTTSEEHSKVHGCSSEPPTERPVETSFMLAFRFDDDGRIVDQWLGSNFVEMLANSAGASLRRRDGCAAPLDGIVSSG